MLWTALNATPALWPHIKLVLATPEGLAPFPIDVQAGPVAGLVALPPPPMRCGLGCNAEQGGKTVTLHVTFLQREKQAAMGRQLLNVGELIAACPRWRHKPKGGPAFRLKCSKVRVGAWVWGHSAAHALPAPTRGQQPLRAREQPLANAGPARPAIPPCSCQASIDDLRTGMEVAQRTDILVGVHGAHLANGVFARPGSALVEITPYEVCRKGQQWTACRQRERHTCRPPTPLPPSPAPACPAV
jgi:hypothetical protein